MKTRLFGSTGRAVSIVGQGSWPLPDVAALRHGIRLGMTHIDTAEMYGNGRSEELVGEAIRDFPREDIFLVSKVLPSNGRRAALHRACEASLRRLGVDELDCYLLHWRGEVELAETIGALAELVTAGKTRAIGVSNLDPWDLREAQAVQSAVPIVCNQVYYNVLERTVEAHELPYAREHAQALVAYTPLGGLPWAGAGRTVLERIAKKYATEPSTIALAFLLRWPECFVIPKAAQLHNVTLNAQAGEIKLTAAEIADIETVFPRRDRVGPLPMN